jgi:hypothetical protein
VIERCTWVVIIAVVVCGPLRVLAGAEATASLPHASAARVECPGDCNGDGQVMINELVTGVSIALDQGSIDACPACDRDGNGMVAVNELIAAVSNALGGCPVSDAALGGTLAVTRALTGVSSFVLAITRAVNIRDNQGGAGTCPGGGTSERTCESVGQNVAKFPLTLHDCAYDTPEGVLSLDGTIALTGVGLCPGFIVPSQLEVEAGLTATLFDGDGAPLRISRYDLSGTLQSVTFMTGPCQVAGGSAVFTGSVQTGFPGLGELTLDLDGTHVTVEFADFVGSCEPTQSTLTLDGAVQLHDALASPAFDFPATLTKLIVVQRESDPAGATLTVDGAIDAACFGGTATVDTAMELTPSVNGPCLRAGALDVTLGRATARMRYGDDGSVAIDLGADGRDDRTFDSCVVSPLRMCVQ